MTFGSLWGHFGAMMCICGGLEGPFSIRSLPASIFWRVSIEVFTFLKALPLFFHKYMPPLVGPKSGNVEKVLVFKAFLKGSKRPRVI